MVVPLDNVYSCLVLISNLLSPQNMQALTSMFFPMLDPFSVLPRIQVPIPVIPDRFPPTLLASVHILQDALDQVLSKLAEPDPFVDCWYSLHIKIPINKVLEPNQPVACLLPVADGKCWYELLEEGVRTTRQPYVIVSL